MHDQLNWLSAYSPARNLFGRERIHRRGNRFGGVSAGPNRKAPSSLYGRNEDRLSPPFAHTRSDVDTSPLARNATG